ncbi:enoyl-CoA hydratase/isomerase family protein [Streptomyces sp. NBC_00102]|uniref:enoyl-CoA hydratase/isomerase family protein n=1 Tax=Streptomyces sp. NBC_00102 TaxID=2975652 RepID=UPI00225BAD18|nr:enoyl-CoA hydratase/isomerase family protein [Streptomyces sp. NBC_00102]MCX5401905.1 enoyl-CoA hydratase/isomerase family protein [Streptomyces sp. NBC_00102]
MNDDAPVLPVLLRDDGHVRHITLNRPRVLNALDHASVRALDAALAAAGRDDAVTAVVISGAGARGLCAGGDIRALHDDARAGGSASLDFWRDEYRLNARIHRFPKPYVAYMDGIVMGGGVGISAHGSVRVVTERSRVAMPETAIGFVPDVGGLHLLSRAPGELGTHLALTGRSVGAADALLCGLADHHVRSGDLPALTAALSGCGTPADITRTVRSHATDAGAGELDAARGWIDTCYTADTVGGIVDRLRDHGAPAAKETADTLLTLSPTALAVTLAAVRRARAAGSLEESLDQDFRVSSRAFAHPDFVEGVRARIVDKDYAPRWAPPRIEDVRESEVARYFAPLGAEELGLAPAPGDG